jgi:stage IV sporulation protein FB
LDAVSIQVATLGVTRLYFHITFLLAALILVLSGFGLHLLVFAGSLAFHELGHILWASFMGAEITRVEIWPFGASAKLERSWQLTPSADGMVALAGPFNSGILASVASAFQRGLMQSGSVVTEGTYPLLDLLVKVNLGLFLMNLVPCLPLDGGRLVRSRLALKVGYVEASRKMAGWGLAAGTVMTVAGFLGLAAGFDWYSLAVFGPVIIWGAADERESAASQNIMEILNRSERLRQRRAIPVSEIMVPHDATVAEVVSKLRPSRYHMILVAGRNMKVLGRVTETRLLEAFYGGGTHLRMRDLWDRTRPE